MGASLRKKAVGGQALKIEQVGRVISIFIIQDDTLQFL
jgi:hypothetical protein